MTLSNTRNPAFCSLQRLLFAIALIWVPFLGVTKSQAVPASASLLPLDGPAIAVRSPDKVFLDAITKAGNRLVAAGEHGVIIYSDDSGQSWRQANVPADVMLTSVAFATPLDGWAAGHDGIILHTADGGQNWQIQLDGRQANELTLAAAQAAATEGNTSPGAPYALRRANIFMAAGPSKPFFTIRAADAEDATIFGAYRMVMKTTDGGHTWADDSLNIGDPYSHDLYDVAQAGAQICIAAETGLVFCSKDGGNTYLEIGQPADATLFGILPVGNNGMLIFGEAGRIFRSDDAGKTWVRIDLGTNSGFTAGRVLKSGAIVLVDEAGELYISRDQAQSFQRLPEIQHMPLFDLEEAPDGNIILVGFRGVVTMPARDFSQH